MPDSEQARPHERRHAVIQRRNDGPLHASPGIITAAIGLWVAVMVTMSVSAATQNTVAPAKPVAAATQTGAATGYVVHSILLPLRLPTGMCEDVTSRSSNPLPQLTVQGEYVLPAVDVPLAERNRQCRLRVAFPSSRGV